MQSFEIKFQTSALVPAPFAHAVELNLKVIADKLHYHYQLSYIDRDTLEIDEILEEGFTENDDQNLSGILPASWFNYFKDLSANISPLKIVELADHQAYWEIGEVGKLLYPKNFGDWELFIEHLRQAALEEQKLELPLKVQIWRKFSAEDRKYEIMASFYERNLHIIGQKETKNLEWNKLADLLKDIFAAEFIYEKASEQEPQRQGLFLEYGDGLWFEVGYSLLTKPSKITRWLDPT